MRILFLMKEKRKIKAYQHIIKPLLALLVFALMLYLGYLAQSSALLQNLAASGGYVGVFFFAFLNGFNVFVPVLSTSFLPVWTASGLNSVVIIALITIAMTMADSVAFFIAKLSGDLTEPKSSGLLHRLTKLKERYDSTPLIVLFIWSIFAPLPNEVILIPLGILGYKTRSIMPIILIGNLAFNTLTALGITNLFRWLL